MANTFPTLASGSMVVAPSNQANPLAKYPVTQSGDWATRIVTFIADQEQSWTVRRNLATLVLSYTRVNGYDTARVVDFFQQMKGMFVDTALLNVFSISINGTTFDYCTFNMDEITVSEDYQCPGYFTFQISIRQLRPN